MKQAEVMAHLVSDDPCRVGTVDAWPRGVRRRAAADGPETPPPACGRLGEPEDAPRILGERDACLLRRGLGLASPRVVVARRARSRDAVPANDRSLQRRLLERVLQIELVDLVERDRLG